MKTIGYNIGRRFSETPGGRFARHGPHSGEALRGVLCTLLRRAIDSGDRLEVDLDGTAGYCSAFLEETFGGLVRSGMFSREDLRRHLRLRANDPLYETYRLSAERYMAEAWAIQAAPSSSM